MESTLMQAYSVRVLKLLLLLMMGGMSACGSGTETWKEEVLLHDGSKIIVERSQTFGGRHEFGQSPPVREHSVIFTSPSSSNPITWRSEFSEDIGHSNFELLVLDVVDGSPYVVAYPTGCLAYNKWGRPNPPYVFFKYADEQWKKIDLVELPSDIKQPNVLIDTYGHADVEQSIKSGFITSDKVMQFNSTLKQEELRSIVRLPVKHVGVDCGVMVRVEGSVGGWVSPGGAKAPVPASTSSPDKK